MSRRTYNQYCATARALDVVGERWTLLLVREMLTGPKRFGDLLDSLPGMGTGLLAARLKYLRDEGLVRQVTLPAPARTPAYALTEAGADLEQAVMALARWGMTWAFAPRGEGEAFRPGWAVLGMRATFDADAFVGMQAVYEFRVDDDVFHARVDDGTLESREGPAQRPDVVRRDRRGGVIELAAGRLALADAVRAGSASVSGDQRAARKLRGLFRRPATAVPDGGRGAPLAATPAERLPSALPQPRRLRSGYRQRSPSRDACGAATVSAPLAATRQSGSGAPLTVSATSILPRVALE